jgi:hypothetical protein
VRRAEGIFATTHLAASAHQRNHVSTSIELSKTSALPAPATQAGIYLFNHYRVPADLADLLAALAGLGEVEARQ